MREFILADNQDITREGLVSLLGKLAIASEIIEVSSRKELMEQLSIYPNAAVILDYTLFDFSDFQMMNAKQRYSDSIWLLFSDELSKHFLRQVLMSGNLFGVVMKTDSMDDIAKALQRMANGKIYLCDLAVQVLREDVPNQQTGDKLTASERMVLREIGLGKTTKEIAYEHNLSFHTINTHRKNIFRKLEINNMYDAVKYALRAGIIDSSEYYI
ncbi:MAG: response regulator transcription factor [Prevotellaceae bacterium]|jgi:DNA-binding NarL/FixJ family response regulator|nr:response regulator transcription factor [Prevotellaceae bacterium]